ncbi:MAG: 16S rRNA (adenine1518-N6/adenine1519-N6)-dimethyltransferase [Anaerolineaceae bacterium]|nr:MAG: 16S rRNA (adenine1518-N6/adenine1519-N6)-dimethyltransferase [Anaerolineaceae bacterium]
MNEIPLPPLDVPALLRQYGLRPHKGLGQNFLQDESVLREIVSVADLEPVDTVLEIGPGLGSLTRHLALAARSVTAVELDRNLFPPLKKVLAPYKNVRLVQGDILALDPADLVDAPDYVVVANIPYYITSAVIRHLLESSPRPRRIVLTVQKEVAARICAAPGGMSLLALSVQVYGQPSIAAHIPAEAFYPAPSVDSAVVRMDIYLEPVISSARLETFFRLAKAGFGQKRKTLRNSLASLLGRDGAGSLLAAAGIDPMRRAETLSLEEWGKLVVSIQ